LMSDVIIYCKTMISTRAGQFIQITPSFALVADNGSWWLLNAKLEAVKQVKYNKYICHNSDSITLRNRTIRYKYYTKDNKKLFSFFSNSMWITCDCP
jgi:hypothetical protein